MTSCRLAKKLSPVLLLAGLSAPTQADEFSDPAAPALTLTNLSLTQLHLTFGPFPSADQFTIQSGTNLGGAWASNSSGHFSNLTWTVATGASNEFFRLQIRPLSSNALLTATVLNRVAYGPPPELLDRLLLNTGTHSAAAYTNALRLGHGFAALRPSLKFLAPAYNAGELLMIHRVGYANQSRSHFESQAYWENGVPNSASREGIFYRTLVESGVLATNPIAGISIQSALPTIFKGSNAALTNISDPTRYELLGTPTPTGDLKLSNSILHANQAQFTNKRSRELLQLSYQNLSSTLDRFATINFDESGNTFTDDVATDIGTTHYPLFPTTAAKNGGGTTATQVVDAGAYSFFEQLKAAALIWNKTSAVIAGTEMSGFDTHDNQGGVTGEHANLPSRIGWAIYALRKYFQQHGDQVTWNNLVIVTLTEFGRTTAQNSNSGTDHAEAGLMWVAGGGVKGLGKGGRTNGVIGCSPSDSVAWTIGPAGRDVWGPGALSSARGGLPFGARPSHPRPPWRDAESVEQHHPWLRRTRGKPVGWRGLLSGRHADHGRSGCRRSGQPAHDDFSSADDSIRDGRGSPPSPFRKGSGPG